MGKKKEKNITEEGPRRTFRLDSSVTSWSDMCVYMRVFCFFERILDDHCSRS